MEGKRLVIVWFLWMLPLGLNSTVTLQPNHHSTDFRGSEVTATSDKVSPLEMAQEHLNNAPDEGHHSTVAPSVELKLTVKSEPQTPDQVSTRYILGSYRPSIHPLSTSTKRNSQSPQDRQSTRYKNNSTVEITADGAEETLPTMGNQPLFRRDTPFSKDEVSSTASPRPGPSELSTQTTSPTPNQPTVIQTGPGPSNPPMSQSNNSTERIRPTPTGVGFRVTPTRAEFTLNTGGEAQLPSTPSQAPVTSRRSTPSRPTEIGPTGPSELPSAATSPATLPPSSAMTKSSTHISTPWTSTQPAKTLATTAASVTASIAVTSTKGQSTPMVPTTKQVTAATTTAGLPPPTKTANEDKSKTTGNHGTMVAVLTGVMLVLMLVGFGVIFVRKRKQQRMQLQNTAWAGPSPFLDGGVQSRLDNDESSDVHLRGSNRISFSGFLSQRLSKRLSLLQETDEEFRMGEIPAGSTFGRETVSDDVQPSNGTAAVHNEKTQTEEPPDNSSSPSPPTASETTATAHTHDHQPPASLQVVDLGPDNAPNGPRSPSRMPPDIPEAVPPPLLDVYLGPPSDQASPPSPESTDLPPPPL
ncbi:hypothetical protein J4Q44_G00327220 [Coregonus suidteri]|uniref:Uncharacterized protein n=1 Tax=Coregonus suidteri TaxID=861788 RepID=A0AAN8KWG6_9TELE